MSAFNRSRFNLSRYNIESAGQIWLEGESQTTFGFAYKGQTVLCRGNSLSTFLGNILVDSGRIFRGSSSVMFDKSTDVIGYFNLRSDVDTSVVAEINLSQIVEAAGTTVERFDGSINLSQIAWAEGATADSVDIDKMNLSQIAWTDADSGEVFAATVDVVSLAEYVCELSGLTLKPGQVLVIDAASFNVLLDGGNAIYLHKGEWLRKMNRKTQSITITGTGATRLEAEILYTERYL